VGFFEHKAPDLIQLQDITRFRRKEQIIDLGQFLNMRFDPLSDGLSSNVKNAFDSA